MSRLVVGNIDAPFNTNNVVSFSPRMTYPGMVIQTVTKRVDTRVIYTSTMGGFGTTLTEMGITVTPIYPESTLIVQWMINGEGNNDIGFLIQRDTALITASGEQGFNNNAGYTAWSCYVSGQYDRNIDSTPQNWNITYTCQAGGTATRTYAPSVKTTSGFNPHQFSLNRVIAGSTQDAYESMVSFGFVYEVCNR